MRSVATLTLTPYSKGRYIKKDKKVKIEQSVKKMLKEEETFGIKKYKTRIKDNVFIGSNSSLVAPITLAENSIVGAGSVITRNVSKKSLALTRSQQLEVKNYKRKSK